MRLFKYLLILCLAVVIQQQTASAAFMVNVTFDDVINNTGVGFDDPVNGMARRDTLTSVFNYVSSQLDPTTYSTAIDYEVGNSETDGTGFLAASGPLFFTSPNGFQNGLLYDHATSGSDPAAGFPDAQATFDFGYSWHTGTSSNPGGLYDLFSVTLHEFTHAMGFLSLLNSDGTSGINATDPGVFSVYDSFLEKGDGTKLFNGAAGDFTGSSADLVSGDVFFNGTNADAANGGSPVKVFAPNPYQSGSSLSHIDSSISAVMNPSIAAGVEKRQWSSVDRGVLEDIGWVMVSANAVPEPCSAVLLGLGAMGMIVLRRRRDTLTEQAA